MELKNKKENMQNELEVNKVIISLVIFNIDMIVPLFVS